MTRLIRDFAMGIAFGLGTVIARLFALPLLLIAAGAVAWAGGWSALHHTSWILGAQHVALVAEHWLRVALHGVHAPTALAHRLGRGT